MVFSAPAKDDSHTTVTGINEGTYKTKMRVLHRLHNQWPGPCCTCTTREVRRLVDHMPLHDRFSANCAKLRPVKGKLIRMALCVPTFDVSVVDLTVELEKATTY